MLMKTTSGQHVRTFDGSDNNEQHPDWGKVGTQLRRATTVDYADGISALAQRGPDNPNPRVISNVLCRQTESIPSRNHLSDFVWAWGQFLDHTIDLTEMRADESVPIPTPHNDPVLPNATIPFNRSEFDPDTGTGPGNPRQQINQISTYIDASNVYGSSKERADALRTFDGTGRLKTSISEHGPLLPYNVDGLPNAALPGMPPESLFIAGDIRANEHAVLTCMHTLFVREHNRLCGEILACHPQLYGHDETIYQEARRIVGGIIQSITYHEFLPLLLGENALAPYTGYKNDVNASIANVFSTACYRLGHSMLSSTLKIGTRGKTLRLRDAFFNPSLVRFYGLEPFFTGMAVNTMQEIDTRVVEDVRSFLFEPPDPATHQLLDLPALNIQRGRDHGLPGYNECRRAFDLDEARNFSDITSDESLQKELKHVYKKVEYIDPWIGGLAEDHVEGANVGPLILAVLKDQFERLRDGDRFWYQHDPELSEDRKTEIANTRLSDVIRRNTSVTGIAGNVFITDPHAKTRKSQKKQLTKHDHEADD